LTLNPAILYIMSRLCTTRIFAGFMPLGWRLPHRQPFFSVHMHFRNKPDFTPQTRSFTQIMTHMPAAAISARVHR